MKNLFLIRHCQTEDPAIYYGQLDGPLSKEGLVHSEEVACIMKKIAEEENLEFKKILTSPQSRCTYLASLLGSELEVPAVVDDRIAAKSYGDWAGLEKAKVRSWIKDGDRIDVKWSTKGPQGESPLEVAERAGELLCEMIDSGTVNCVLVTHAGVMKAIEGLLSSITESILKDYEYGEIVRFRDIERKAFYNCLMNKYREII